jgi:CBS-domain-containing membrane protein
MLIAVGFLQVVTGRGFDGLWLALIGLFLVNAASAEEQQAQVGAALHGVRVRDVMSAKPVAAHPDETVSGLIDRLVMSRRLSTYPLVDENRMFVGLVTLNRIREVPPEARATTRLREIACPPGEVPRSTMEEPLIGLLSRMTGCADGRAVVLDPSGHLVGLLTPSDISRAIQTAGLRGNDPYPHPRGADMAMPHRDTF